MELWGGVECTVNRVGDRYRDQLHLTGHHGRIGDLALIADLGVRAMRMPVLWERVAPEAPDRRDWGWCDERLGEARRLGMRPIAGLLHHGSGPAYTSLMADNFVELFTDYAAAAAERYPWVTDWTPVNEPLTTARFSALYGAWYPHARSTREFWSALLTQTEATVAAMAAIRRTVPNARLIQTDDLGEAFGSGTTAPVVDYYNHRRWLGWDLLTGRVTRDHPLWDEGDALGFGERLAAIAAAPCPPDIIGIDHYLTSDRVLLPRPASHAGPDDPGYDDHAGIRVLDPPPGGVGAALRQAWARYGIPLAITENHLGCTREEQLRWFRRGWDDALAARAEGVDVRAVTAWALLGSMDWVSLVTQDAGVYESGAFDVRGPTPRPTALARLVGSIGSGQPCPPVLQELAAGAGWWEREVRFDHPSCVRRVGALPASANPRDDGRPILIHGAAGTLGQAFAGACRLRGLPYVETDPATLRAEDPEAVARVLDRLRPWAVIDAAGRVRADEAGRIAPACAERGVHCTAFSTELDDGPEWTGRAGEPTVAAARMDAPPDTLVVRTGAFFSPFDTGNFAMALEARLRAGEVFDASAEHIVTPTYVPDLVRVTLDLIIDGETGLWTLTHDEALTWLAFGRRIATALDLDPDLVVAAAPSPPLRPAGTPLPAQSASARDRLLPTLDVAVATHAAERRRDRPGPAHSAATTMSSSSLTGRRASRR